jgi:hypothetical protein
MNQKILPAASFRVEIRFAQRSAYIFVKSHGTPLNLDGLNPGTELKRQVGIGVKAKVIAPAAL